MRRLIIATAVLVLVASGASLLSVRREVHHGLLTFNSALYLKFLLLPTKCTLLLPN